MACATGAAGGRRRMQGAAALAAPAARPAVRRLRGAEPTQRLLPWVQLLLPLLLSASAASPPPAIGAQEQLADSWVSRDWADAGNETKRRLDLAEPVGSGSDRASRRLDLATFTGWSLTRPLNSNVQGYTLIPTGLGDVRAGVPYNYIRIHATSGLGADAAAVRVKLVLASAAEDTDCYSSVHDVPHMVHTHSPLTPLDGLTAARVPAFNYQNDWLEARFPYSGEYEACYYSGISWFHIGAPFTVKGASTNDGSFWCVASNVMECRLMITGLGVRNTWYFSPTEYADPCGSVGPEFRGGAFELNYSSATENIADATQIFHNIGRKLSLDYNTYRVCYCSGFKADTRDGNPLACHEPADVIYLHNIMIMMMILMITLIIILIILIPILIMMIIIIILIIMIILMMMMLVIMMLILLTLMIITT